MPNLPSAWKRMRQNERRRLRNRSARSLTRTWMRKVEAAARSKDPNLETIFRNCVRKIDQAAARGVLHRNTASRRKARMARLLSAATKGKQG